MKDSKQETAKSKTVTGEKISSAMKTVIETSEECAEGIKKSVEEVLKYKRISICEERGPGTYGNCAHYSNADGSEGLVHRMIIGGVVRTSEGPKGFGGLQFYGYGKRWKGLGNNKNCELKRKCKKVLGLPRKELYRLTPEEVVNLLQLENFAELETPDSKIPPYIA